MEASKYRIGVVPEHFSIPFHVGKERGIFEKHGVQIEIEEFPRGTGSMCRALRQNELDIAVALTEGIINDIATNGNEITTIATYVESPLRWGIWVKPDAKIDLVGDLKGKTFGISRFGSGSHLMVSLLGTERGWNLEKDVTFSVKGGIQDLLHGITDNSTDAFLWEKFTTKHYAEENLVRLIGEIPTPWPCFVVACRSELLKEEESLKKLLAAVRASCEAFLQDDTNVDMVSKTSKLSKDDSKKWLNEVKFSTTGAISQKVFNEAVDILVKTGILKEKCDFKKLVAQNVAVIAE